MLLELNLFGKNWLFQTRERNHSNCKNAKAQARNQLGTLRGEEFSERDPNFLNYVQYIFPGDEKFFPRGASPPWLGA